ncbi:putative glycosidase CRH2 [Purpureocillium takamizusanense]|uniref:Crh-like protein n=1 Tax=Purpureocillium takamizusanense TaxID=2060973 RepID=A0A9Q8QPJ7_9HYPO|nr:putative glycosidase CRH2 [Purpureocillium takamizusanense]UNI22931.1 putative glycosidase CRH2 [Purpureocillium takamizusanense]
MLRSAALAALLGASSVLAGTKCSLSSKCPKESPCCSQYGECGVGAYCLGGCDPRSSFSLDACAPAPVCKSTTTKFDSKDSIVDIGEYLGDASKADWVAQGEPAIHDGSVLLTMPRKSVGTVLASTSYMWYGNVKAKFKTSRGRGVVTAFILLSDVKDEIDYEFVGVDLQTAQTNYYFQGITDYHNSGNISLSDTFHNFHEYEIRWTPDKVEWLVDGQVGRTKLRKDTWNETSQQWMFPQTPARVQLSIWPGGLASNAKGTIDWAGGEIDWDAEDIKKAGYFYATFSEVSIECYDAKSPPGTNHGKSYTYTSTAGTNDTVKDGDKDTVMGSLLASGLDMNKGKKSSSSASTSAEKPTNTQNTIPGGGKGGGGGNDHSGDKGGSSSSGGSGGSSGNNGGSGAQPTAGGSSGCSSNSFNQDCNSGSKDGGSGGKSGSSKASASALAMIIAGVALFWL